MKLLFLWGPQSIFTGSLFKHYGYFGETIGYFERKKSFDISVMDAGVELFAYRDYVRELDKTELLLLYIEPYNIESSIKIARVAKGINPKIKIFAFGVAVNYMPEFMMNSGTIDAVPLNSEWELCIEDYICYLNKKISNDDLSPIIIKEGDQWIKGNKVKSLEGNLWGHPALSKLPIDKYFKLTGRKQLEINVSKGCPYPCTFCAEHVIFGKKDKRRSVDNLIDFIDQTHTIADQYYFSAATYTLDEDYVKEVNNRIINLPYQVKWRAVTRIDRVNEEMLRELSEAGCYKISFGVETLSSNLQKDILKPISQEKLLSTFEMCKKYKIIPRALIMVGLPGQTKEDIKYTYDKLNEWDVEVRAKEYFPYNDMLRKNNVTMNDIKKLDRTEFYHNPVPDISYSEFMQLLYRNKDI
ncbi:Radical SAM superfamily protein [Paenibacillaceae bacterium GAS479]|nr:Radical SAM superfamily protein [Paenibacillaceae bacterium GAS479]